MCFRERIMTPSMIACPPNASEGSFLFLVDRFSPNITMVTVIAYSIGEGKYKCRFEAQNFTLSVKQQKNTKLKPKESNISNKRFTHSAYMENVFPKTTGRRSQAHFKFSLKKETKSFATSSLLGIPETKVRWVLPG